MTRIHKDLSETMTTLGLNMAEFAERVGVSRRTVQRWMSGDRRMSRMAWRCVTLLIEVDGLRSQVVRLQGHR